MMYSALKGYGELTVSEKIALRGASALSDRELLQSVVSSGTGSKDCAQAAKNLNAVIEKIGIDNLTFDDLLEVKGIGKAKASLIFSMIEFMRRKMVKPTAPLIDSPEKAYEQVKDIANKKQEHFVLLTLDGARRLINKHVVSIGTH